MFSMDRVLQEPLSPPLELLLLVRLCPRRGERGRRGERPGLPDADPSPLDPTASSFETERELPYMVRGHGVCTGETKKVSASIEEIEPIKNTFSKVHGNSKRI